MGGYGGGRGWKGKKNSIRIKRCCPSLEGMIIGDKILLRRRKEKSKRVINCLFWFFFVCLKSRTLAGGGAKKTKGQLEEILGKTPQV